MSYPMKRYYDINRFFLSIIGMWPHQSEKTKLIRTIYTQIAMLLCIIIPSIQIVKLDRAYFDIKFFLKATSFALFYLCVATHYYVDLIEIKIMNVIWNRIEYDWNELITTRGINILKEYASTSRLYNIILIGLYYVTVIFLIFQTILPTFLDVVLPLNESRPLRSPILMDSLIEGTIYFYPTLVSTYILLIFFGIVTTAVNGFFVVCIQHACAMFQLVRYTLDEAFENVDKKLYVNEENERIYQKIIRTIKAHRSAIEFVENVNIIYEKVTFLYVLIGFFIIAVDILQLLRIESIEENLEDILMCAFHLFGSFCWGLMGNMLCQSIIDHSSATFEQAYLIPWYLIRPKTRRLILLLMMNSLKPCYISVGTVFVSCNEFFVTFLHTIISYTMIIYSLQ